MTAVKQDLTLLKLNGSFLDRMATSMDSVHLNLNSSMNSNSNVEINPKQSQTFKQRNDNSLEMVKPKGKVSFSKTIKVNKTIESDPRE